MNENAEIICADSLPWMLEHAQYGHVITSLPDAEELNLQFPEQAAEYQSWFANAAFHCFRATAPGGVTVFIQTDRLSDGRWFSKVKLLFETAGQYDFKQTDVSLLFHKIELRREPGKTDLFRPTYRHILAFGKYGARPGERTPDVIGPGSAIYANGISTEAAYAAVHLAAINNPERPVLDPFCGRGTIPYVAAKSGLKTLGIDIDPEQCEKARGLINGILQGI